MSYMNPRNRRSQIKADRLVERTPDHTIEIQPLIIMPHLPVSASGLSPGQLWRDASDDNKLKVVPTS